MKTIVWEWLSEQNNYNNARIAGDNACSNINNNNVNNGNRFRAVFRPLVVSRNTLEIASGVFQFE